jgi:hypothetical protein
MELLLPSGVYTTTQKLDAFSQLHVARKLGPAMPILEGMVDKRNEDKNKDLLTVLMLSQLPDDDAEYIVRRCLSVVSRHSGKVLAPVLSKSGLPMFEDMSMAEMLELTVAVVEENLGDFFRGSLAVIAAGPEAENPLSE